MKIPPKKNGSEITDAASNDDMTTSVRWIIVSLSLSMLLSSLGTSIANVGLPTLAHAFDASFQQVQWVLLAYLLAITTLIVSVGRFGDLIGRRRLLLVGIALFTLASVFCATAPTLWMLIAARTLQGLGAAIMMALTMAFVSEAVPKKKAGSAMGLLGTMSAVGTALGPSLGGILIGSFGWRSIFFINLPLGLLTLGLAYRFLPIDRVAENKKHGNFDKLGTVFLALTLGAYALAMTVGRGHFGTVNALLLLGAILGLGLFVLTEKKATSPLVDLMMFRNPSLSGGFIMSALVTTVVMATLVVGPFYLSGALILNAAQVGLVMSSGPIVAALAGIPAGKLVDRFGADRMVLVGLVIMLIGTSVLPVLPMDFGIPGYVAPLALITAGYALFQAANNTGVMANIQPDRRGVISGMLNLSRNLGLVTGASLMGAIFAIGSATKGMTTPQPEAVAAGMHLTFTASVALIALALYVAFLSRSRTNTNCECGT